MNAENRLLELFSKNPEWTANELSKEVGVSKQTIHKILKKLTENGELKKFGTAPKTFYRKSEVEKISPQLSEFNNDEQQFLKQNFLVISENGQFLEGAVGFENWCKKEIYLC